MSIQQETRSDSRPKQDSHTHRLMWHRALGKGKILAETRWSLKHFLRCYIFGVAKNQMGDEALHFRPQQWTLSVVTPLIFYQFLYFAGEDIATQIQLFPCLSPFPLHTLPSLFYLPERTCQNVGKEGKGTHESRSSARSTAALGVCGVQSQGGQKSVLGGGQRDRRARGFIVSGDSASWHIRSGCEVGAQFSGLTGSGCLRSRPCVRPKKQPRDKIKVKKVRGGGGAHGAMSPIILCLSSPSNIPSLSLQSELPGPCSSQIGQAVSKTEGQGICVYVCVGPCHCAWLILIGKVSARQQIPLLLFQPV